MELTILTEAPWTFPPEARRRLRNAARWLYHHVKPLVSPGARPRPRMGGPEVVRANLLKGLDRIGQPYRFNPPFGRVSPYVGVLSNVNALRWAIRAKRRGRIARLVAGPNLVVTPLEAGGVLFAPEIDVVVTPSRWVSDWYVSLAPELAARVVEWPAGVDTTWWCPQSEHRSSNPLTWLVYDKTALGGKEEMRAVLSELKRRREPHEIIVYGTYTPEEYRSALRRARALIMLSPSESQGIALLEAWACGVPTLVWDRGYYEYSGASFGASSAPYLRGCCGMSFATGEAFPAALDRFVADLPRFRPRDLVMASFTLEACASAYAQVLVHSRRSTFSDAGTDCSLA